MSALPVTPPTGPPGTGDTPVTAFVTRAVKPGREADYEAWLHRLLADAAELPGYLGAEIHPPAAGPGPVVYTSVVHFDGPDSLRQFEQSDMRRGHLAEVTDLVAGDAVWGRRTGLDLWFPPPLGTTAPQPVRWRMAVILAVVVYVLVIALQTVAEAVIGGWPEPVVLAIVVAAQIALVTWVVLPPLTRLLAPWIYPPKRLRSQVATR